MDYQHKTITFVAIKDSGKGRRVPFVLLATPVKPHQMIEKRTIEQIVEKYMEDNRLVLVDVKDNKANNIKVFFRALDRPVCIDDCVALSRFIEAGLDRDKEDFSLMVSSAGDNCDNNENDIDNN